MNAEDSTLVAYWIIGSVVLIIAAFAAITLWKILQSRKWCSGTVSPFLYKSKTEQSNNKIDHGTLGLLDTRRRTKSPEDDDESVLGAW